MSAFLSNFNLRNFSLGFNFNPIVHEGGGGGGVNTPLSGLLYNIRNIYAIKLKFSKI